MRLIIFLVAIVFLTEGCSKCNDVAPNDVYIRLHNETGLDVVNWSIGSAMYKGVNSFKSCILSVGGTEIPQGVTTEYFQTKGGPIGYDGVRIEWFEESGRKNNATDRDALFEAQLLENGAQLDSVQNVYNNDWEKGLRLPDGNYTFTIFQLSENRNVFDITIIKD